MTIAAAPQPECTCVGPIVALRAEDIVRPPASGSALEAAFATRRARLSAAHPWWGLGSSGAATAPDIAGPSIFAAAAAADAGGIHVHLPPDAPPATEAAGRASIGLAAVRHALDVGGVVLERCGRFSAEIADLVDEAAELARASVRPLLVSGAVPDGAVVSSASASASVAVAAIAGEVTLGGADGDVLVPAGTWHRARSVMGVRTSHGGLALVLVVDELDRVDVWEHLVRKASYWPRLRADIPYDIAVPVVAYGEHDPVDFVSLVTGQVAELESEETLAEAVAGARARIRPSERSVAPGVDVPSGPASWSTAVVRGRLPGGVGWIAPKEPGRSILAFAGCAVFVDPHLGALFDQLATGDVVWAADVPSACPAGDPECVGRALDVLHPLGVVDVVDPAAVSGLKMA